jgi:peptidyl-prolyl cis-trans isomerase C
VKQILCVAAVLAATAACQKAPAPAASASATPTPAPAGAAKPAAAPAAPTPTPVPAKPVPAQLPEVVARVNGDAITKSDFEQAVKTLEARNGGQPVPTERRNEIYRGLLDDLITLRLLKQEVSRQQMNVADAELEGAMKQLRGQFPDEKRFQQALQSEHLTLVQLREQTRQNIAVSKLLEHEVGPKISVKPTDISAFYEKNPDKFQQPEAIRASHVLVAVRQQADEATRKAARAKAEDVLKQARAGADFSNLARKLSNDASAPRGGDLGFFPKGQMVPAFEAAAFALQPGQVSDVVETPFGYHVIKVTERRPPQTVPFAQAAPRIEQYLRQEQQQELTKAYVQGLRGKNKVEVLI